MTESSGGRRRSELRSDRLQLLVAVAREGGVSRAARALGLSQSSVSEGLAALEADVGEAILDRSARGFRLTQAGSVLLRHAREVVTTLDAAREALGRLDALTSGSVSVGASDTFATHLLPPVFAAFREAYPRLELRLDNRPSPTLASRVAERALDLAVVSLPLPRVSAAVDALTQVPLLSLRDVLIGPTGHPLLAKPRVTLEQLADESLVLLDRSTATRAWLERQFRERKIAPRVVMEMSSLEVLKRLVELDFGLSIVPEVAVVDEIRSGKLVARPLRALPTRKVGLLLPGAPTRAASAFASVARRVLHPVS